MTDAKPPPKPVPPDGQNNTKAHKRNARDARLRQTLRANLQKRKAQKTPDKKETTP